MTTRDNNNDELALWDALLNESIDGASSDGADESGRREEDDAECVDPYERAADASLAFEQSWTLERDVEAIEERLQVVPEEFRDELFERLLEIDATLSAKKGRLLAEAEYCALFPNRVKAVKRAYATALAEPSVAAALRVGREVGPYKIKEIVGVGGMGVVYKARDARFGRVVALKFLSTSGGDRREERVERFKREIWLMGQTPPGSAFAQAYDCATDGDFDYYIAMEYVDGVNLARYYRERNEADGRRETGPLPWLDAVKLAREVAVGLAEIHELGFAHRDVKPENVMLDANGRIRILDLGLAVWTEKRGEARDVEERDDEETIDDGVVVGTPAYIAPEARRDPENVDQRSDLYSLGGVLLFLLSGARPIDWFDPAATETPEPFGEFWARREIEIPEEVEQILTRLLEPDCERRYQRADAVVADLDAAIDKYSPDRRRVRRRKRLTRLTAALAGAVAFGCVLFYAFGMSDARGFKKAVALADSGEADQALGAAMNVRPEGLATDKERVEFFSFRGDLYERLAKDDGYLREALEDFEAVLRLDARNVEALKRAAELYAKLREFDKAKTRVESALKLDGNDPTLRLLSGEISVLRGEGENDGKRFSEADNLLTDNLALGDALRKTGDPAWTPDVEAETLYWRARAFYRNPEQLDEFARDDLDDALKLRSDYLEALALRGDVLLRYARKNEDNAELVVLAGRDYQRVAELTDDAKKKAERFHQAAKAYERAKRWDVVVDVCGEALKANQFSAWARLRLERARFYAALPNAVDWNAKAAELAAALPGAINEELESDEFLAEIWAILAFCRTKEAAQAKDDEKKRIQTKIFDAIDEARAAEDDVDEYVFGKETFNLDDVGIDVANDLGDKEKADFYRRKKEERTRDKEERRTRLE